MARLIDADKVRTELVYFTCPTGIDEAPYEFASDIIDKAPTVKAIPIEWLHRIMEKQLIFAMSSEMEGTTTAQDGVIHCVSGALACQVLANVIELWEKENEAN